MSAAFKVTNVTHTSRPHETDQTLTRHTVRIHTVPLGVELPTENFSVVRYELFDRLNGLPGVPDDLIYSQIHKGCTLMCVPYAEDPYSIDQIVSVTPASKL
jgi:hypothetical protein